MIDDINAAPDYGDEPPFACSSVAVLDGQSFACGGTPGHAGKHVYLIWWEGQGDITATRLHDEPKPAERYALVEQMGHRATYASVREVTFCGKPVLEVTGLRTGAVTLVAPESLYQVTWLTESDARARANPWTAVALPAANPNPWGDYGADDYPDNADPDEGKDDGMSAAEREESDDLHGFRLDAADEARDLEREAEAAQ